MNLLNKLTIKNLKLNKKRTIVTIIGIILSVALLTAVSSIYLSGLSSIKKYEIKEKGNYHVAFYDVLKKDIDTLKQNRQVNDLYLTSNIGYARLNASQNEYKPYAYIQAFSKEALDNLAIHVTEGRLPQNKEEIIIPTHLKTNGKVNLKIGQTITLEVGKRTNKDGHILTQFNPFVEGSQEEIIDNVTKTYKIVGIMERPDTNIEAFDAPGYTFITYLEDTPDITNVYVNLNKQGLKNNEDFINNFLKSNNPQYNFRTNSYLINLEIDPLNSSGPGQMIIVVIIVCAIIIFTSIFCIKNSFDISLSEKIKQYGMLRSVGATKKQIRHNVLYEGFILGLIGIPLGIIFGLLACFILIIVSNYFLKDVLADSFFLQFSFSYIAILIAIILGAMTIYFSSLKSAIKASLITPISAIKNSDNIQIKSKKLKSSSLIYHLFGIGGDISYKNIKRNKKKYRTTVISLIVSVAVFIALASFMQYAFLTLKNEVNLYDYNVLLSVNKKDLFPKVEQVTKLEGVKNYSLYKGVLINNTNLKFNLEYLKNNHLNLKEWENKTEENITIASIGSHAYQNYLKDLGLKNNEDFKDQGILFDNIKYSVNQKKKKVLYQTREYTIQKGEQLTGSINNQATKIKVGYISKTLPFGISDDCYSSILIVSDELFDSLHLDNNTMVGYFDVNDTMKFQDNVENIMQDNEYNFNNIDENVKMLRNLYTLVGIFLYGFIIVVSLIGITNIFNTITTNIKLRQREFAMLKSIGMSNKEFNHMIRLESIFTCFKALVFGLTFGLILSYLIYHFLVEEGIKYTPPYMAIIISILVVFFLINMIMHYSLNKIKNQNMIDVIRNENI